jgi:hypothetical protein
MTVDVLPAALVNALYVPLTVMRSLVLVIVAI